MENIVSQITSFGLLIIFAFICGRITRKLRLGEMPGHVVGGFLVGPAFMKFLYDSTKSLYTHSYFNYIAAYDQHLESLLIHHKTAFQTFYYFLPLYFAVSLFTIQEFSHRERVQDSIKKILLTSLIQGIGVSLIVFPAMHFLAGFTIIESLFFAVLSISSSPACALLALNNKRIEGKLRALWSQIITIDTLLEWLLIVIILAVVKEMTNNVEVTFFLIVKDIFKIFSIVFVIAVFLFILSRFIIKNKLVGDEISDNGEGNYFLADMLSADSVPSITATLLIAAILAIGTGISAFLSVPFAVVIIFSGVFISNYHSSFIFDSMKVPNAMAFFHMLFFALIGASLDIYALASVDIWNGIIIYFIARLVGKVVANWLSMHLLKEKPKFKNTLSCMFIPQMGAAGMTILYFNFYFPTGFENIFKIAIPVMIFSEIIGGIFIEKILHTWKNNDIKQRRKNNDSTRQDINISIDSLIQDRVVLDMDVKNRDDAIKLLVAELAKKMNSETDVKMISRLVLEREEAAPTVISEGISLPHCRTGEIEYPTAICGIMSEGESLDWNDTDGQAIRYVFLLISPLSEPRLHIEAMKTLTLYFQKEEFLPGLIDSARDDKAFEYLKGI